MSFGNRCFKAFAGQSANHNDSETLCSSAHPAAVLPSIHDLAENSQMLLMTGQSAYWTGLTNFTGGGAGDWTWDDSSAVNFVNWRPGMPVLHSGRCACVWVYEGDGSWSNAQCNLRLGSVLCQLEV